MKRKEALNFILGLPKSFYWNIRLFGINKGIKLPLLFGKNCIVDVAVDTIELPSKLSTGMIKIGINYGPFNKGSNQNTLFTVKTGARLIFRGQSHINEGGVINITSGTCVLGNNVSANANFLLSCENNIEIGNDVLFGWNCTLIDGDGHDIINTANKNIINSAEGIIIGNHVWCAAQVSILKGTVIKDDSVIGYGSIVTKKYEEANVIVAGQSGRIVKTGITWER